MSKQGQAKSFRALDTLGPSIGPSQSAQMGFTLIEIMLVITLFSLLMTMAYQSIVAGAQAKSIVQARVSQQSMLRAAHRTLQHALSSGARIRGSSDRVEIDLRYADTDWLDGVDKMQLFANRAGELSAVTDNSSGPTVLLKKLERHGFRYLSGGLEYAVWGQEQRPDAVVFYWASGDRQEQWFFSKQ